MTRFTTGILLLFSTTSCSTPDEFRDVDMDGVPWDPDCDDANAQVNPGMSEVLDNGVDDNCDDRTDEVDVDEDGYEALPAGDDCDDSDPDVHVKVDEVCHDGKDNNCEEADCDYAIDEPLTVNDSDDQLIRLTGSEAGAQAGYSVLGLSVDGHPRVLVGAPASNEGGAQAGLVAIAELSEARGELSLERITTRITGATSQDFAGMMLAASDEGTIAVGAPGIEDTGRVALFRDLPEGDVTTDDADAVLVGAVGDGIGQAAVWLNDDGDHDQVAFGAPRTGDNAGGVYVLQDEALTGTVALDASAWPGHWVSTCKGLNAGAALADVLQSDGTSVLAIGAPGQCANVGLASDQGEVLLEAVSEDTGALADLGVVQGSSAHERFGSALASADLDGDGYTDLVVGAPGEIGVRAGSIYIYTNTSNMTDQELDLTDSVARVTGPDDVGLGESLAITPDIDGDDVADLLIGAPDADDGDGDGGVAYLLLSTMLPAPSTSSDIDRVAVTIHPSAGLGAASLGAALGSVSDTNGDGAPELLIGAPTWKGAGANAGAVFVLYGAAE